MTPLLVARLLFASPAHAQPPVSASSIAVRSQGAEIQTDTRTHIRLVGIELGSGLETDLDLLDPFIPAGLDRFLAWDVRLGLREDSIAVKSQYRYPFYFEKISTSFKTRLDTYSMLGLGQERTNIYESLGQPRPRRRGGFALGLTAVKDKHWGHGAGYDETTVHDPFAPSMTQRVFVTSGYTPLGDNGGRRWNWSWVTTLDYVETWHYGTSPDFGYDEGFGISAGPVYQHALKWVKIPWAQDSKRWRERIGLDRFKTSLVAAESEITPFSLDLSWDVTAYVTEHLKLSAGAGANYIPEDGTLKGRLLTGLSLRFNLSDLKL